MLYPDMQPMDPIPSGGGATKPKPEPEKLNVPLVVFTAFDAQTAEALSERLQNTVRPADRAAEMENDPPSSIHAPVQSSEPSLPDFVPEFEEPEISVIEPENAWSSEVPFINLDATEMSYYFSALEDDLVREVSISLQHQTFILFHLDDPLEYLKSFATYTWYEESDEAAEEFIQWYVDRFRTELEEQKEREWSREVKSDLEYWIKYVANDERETIIVYDLDARETLFVRYGDKHSVTMQELHQKLAEGRNIFVIHNHPNHTGASLADLSAVAWLDAEYFVVVNPDGTLHFHKRIGDAMVALEPVHNPDIVAPFDPFETAVAELAYLFQTWSEEGNPPEMAMRQEEAAEEEYSINTESRFVDEFLLDPATIVFLDDVANEYGVEDPALFSAMVATIIYRELSAFLSLENANYPSGQHGWDKLKVVLHLPWYFGSPAHQFQGGPSLGIGALNRDSALKIESDAKLLGWKLYFPALEFDLQTDLDETPFSRGNHRIERAIGSPVLAPRHSLQVLLPSIEERGVWRVELPSLASGSDLRKRYEASLGYIAAEVAIAMQTTRYKELDTDSQRIAYTIGYHANRSRVPHPDLYGLSDLADDSRKQTRIEIAWATEFEGLMDARRS